MPKTMKELQQIIDRMQILYNHSPELPRCECHTCPITERCSSFCAYNTRQLHIAHINKIYSSCGGCTGKGDGRQACEKKDKSVDRLKCGLSPVEPKISWRYVSSPGHIYFSTTTTSGDDEGWV